MVLICFCLPVCLSVCLSLLLRLCVCVCAHLSVCVSVCVCLSVCLSVRLRPCLRPCLFLYVCVRFGCMCPGGDVDTTDSWSCTAVHVAADSGHSEVLQALCPSGELANSLRLRLHPRLRRHGFNSCSFLQGTHPQLAPSTTCSPPKRPALPPLTTA